MQPSGSFIHQIEPYRARKAMRETKISQRKEAASLEENDIVQNENQENFEQNESRPIEEEEEKELISRKYFA